MIARTFPAIFEDDEADRLAVVGECNRGGPSVEIQADQHRGGLAAKALRQLIGKLHRDRIERQIIRQHAPARRAECERGAAGVHLAAERGFGDTGDRGKVFEGQHRRALRRGRKGDRRRVYAATFRCANKFARSDVQRRIVQHRSCDPTPDGERAWSHTQLV